MNKTIDITATLKANDISGARFARAIDRHKMTIHSWLNGTKKPNNESIRRITKYFDIHNFKLIYY